MKTDPTQKQLRVLFEYNPQTGALLWRKRRREEFKKQSQYDRWRQRGVRSAVQTYKIRKEYVEGGNHASAVRIYGEFIQAGRVAYCLQTGVMPSSIIHANGDVLNLCFDNLITSDREDPYELRRRAA